MTKRENDSISLKNLMQSFIKKNNLSKGIQKIKVEEVWKELMGQGVTSYTQSIQLKNKTLIIRLSSSVLREELTHGKDKIIAMINKEMGEEVVSKLMLV
ncbi:MAG: Uncharacterised protein [Flavobacterium sp. SCGC AAA160-P02]|nr:MAG: Uncharacterised protein [Flavobacterium sp. SCGC AAA160-P02]